MSSPAEKSTGVIPTKPPTRTKEQHQELASITRKTGYPNLKTANHIARVHGGIYIVLHVFDDYDDLEKLENQRNPSLQHVSNKSVDEEAVAEAEARESSHSYPSIVSTLSGRVAAAESTELDEKYVVYPALSSR
jgi:hypothetical protein